MATMKHCQQYPKWPPGGSKLANLVLKVVYSVVTYFLDINHICIFSILHPYPQHFEISNFQTASNCQVELIILVLTFQRKNIWKIDWLDIFPYSSKFSTKKVKIKIAVFLLNSTNNFCKKGGVKGSTFMPHV